MCFISASQPCATTDTVRKRNGASLPPPVAGRNQPFHPTIRRLISCSLSRYKKKKLIIKFSLDPQVAADRQADRLGRSIGNAIFDTHRGRGIARLKIRFRFGGPAGNKTASFFFFHSVGSWGRSGRSRRSGAGRSAVTAVTAAIGRGRDDSAVS